MTDPNQTGHETWTASPSVNILLAGQDSFSATDVDFELGNDGSIRLSAAEIARIASVMDGNDTLVIKPPEAQFKQSVACFLQGGLVIDRGKRIIEVDGQNIFNTKREYDLLDFLTHYPNVIIPSQEIYLRVWGSEHYGNTLAVHISRLRGHLGVYASSIVTEPRFGYGFFDETIT